MWSALCADAHTMLAAIIPFEWQRWEVLVGRAGKDDAMVARSIGTLKRVLDSLLMELTEVEVLINARCRRQVDGGELKRTRAVLTSAIVTMDGELEQLQRRRTNQAKRPLASSDEVRNPFGV